MNPRIGLTGLGMISAIGADVDQNLQALRRGDCGISALHYHHTRYADSLLFGEVKRSTAELAADADVSGQPLSRSAILALLAFREAIAMAGLSHDVLQDPRTAFVCGATVGGICLSDEAAIGVTFSITMFITLLSFMSGLNDMLDGLIVNRTPHIRLYNEIQASKNQPIDLADSYKGNYNFIRSVKPKNERAQIYNCPAILNTLNKDPRVLGYAPKIVAQVFYNVGSIDLTGVINGVNVDEEARLFKFRDYVTSGNYIDLKNTPNSIILGKGAAEKMLANIGDVIQVTTSKGERMQLKVVGYFQSGIQDVDKVQSYASIGTTQKLLGESNNYITDIQVKLKDITWAPAMAKEYGKLFDIESVDIQTANSQFETGSSIRSLISYAVGITLLIVAGFGIYNILNMMIYEKMDSIAILKATGFSGSDVNRIFITIALSIGIFGGGVGLLLGFGLSNVIDNIPFNTASLPTIKTFPINYNPKFYLIGAIFSVVTTYFAGYFPSRKASKIDPVVIIRGK